MTLTITRGKELSWTRKLISIKKNKAMVVEKGKISDLQTILFGTDFFCNWQQLMIRRPHYKIASPSLSPSFFFYVFGDIFFFFDFLECIRRTIFSKNNSVVGFFIPSPGVLKEKLDDMAVRLHAKPHQPWFQFLFLLNFTHSRWSPEGFYLGMKSVFRRL